MFAIIKMLRRKTAKCTAIVLLCIYTFVLSPDVRSQTFGYIVINKLNSGALSNEWFTPQTNIHALNDIYSVR